MSDAHSHIVSIFGEALDCSTAEELEIYLQRACGDDLQLRAQVDALLRAHRESGDFLQGRPSVVRPPDDRATADEPGAGVDGVGDIIGPYKLLEQIGEGGMGVVYMADQQTPIRRRVALKIIKPGMDTRRVIARFEAERQALALMDHPNIARVFDAGATATGRPYFAMELVRGVPITEYCDQNQMPVLERLKLFGRVCHAVQHAHQKGIIHRDIKPSNVLVTLHDGQPVPKVIDFGIAKATGQQLTDRTLFTDFHQLIGTPLYMSPEQAELSGLDVDTRSDIYSLGVLLYELLTGTTPLESDRLKQAAYDEVRRIIREEEPPKPSTRASSLEFSQPGVAAVRQTQPRTLCHLLQGDLDWIVMKTLEKDRTRRYATALELAEDIQRHLSDEPVEACPPTALYRLHKLVRRRKWTIAVTALLLAATLTAMITLVVSNRIIRRERDMAQRQRQIARQAVDKMITNVAEKWLAHQAHLTPLQREFLADALAFYEERVQEQSVTSEERLEAGKAYRRMGQIHHKLGHSDKADSAFKQALALLEPPDAKEPLSNDYRVARARCLNEHAFMLNFSDRAPECEEMYARAAGEWQRLVDDFPDAADYRVKLGRSLSGLADSARATTGFAEAEPIYRRALKVLETLPENVAALPETRYILGLTKHEFAFSLGELGRHTESRRLYSEARALYEQLFAESPSEAIYRNELAYAVLTEANRKLATRPHEAERLARKAVALEEELVAESPDVPDYQYVAALCHRTIAVACESSGRLQDAVAEIRRAVEISQKLVTRFPGLRPFVYSNLLVSNRCHLARLLRTTGRDAEAEQEFSQAFSAHLDTEAPAGPLRDRPYYRRELAAHLQLVANAVDSASLFSERLQLLRKAVSLISPMESPASETTGGSSAANWELFAQLQCAQVRLLQNAGRTAEAEAAFRAAHKVLEKLVTVTSGNGTPNQVIIVGELVRGLGFQFIAQQPAHAEVAFRLAFKLFEEALRDPGFTAEEVWRLRYLFYAIDTQKAMGHAVFQQGRSADAEKYFRKASERSHGLTAAFFPANPQLSPYVDDSFVDHGNFLRSAGRTDEAMAVYRQGSEYFARLSRELPGETTIWEAEASLHDMLSDMLLSAGRPAEAAGEIAASCDLYRKLSAEFPDKPDYRNRLTSNYSWLADSRLSESKHAEAEAILRKAMQSFDELAAAHPAEPDYLRRHALFQARLARLQTIADPNDEVEKTIQQAIKSHQTIIEEFPQCKDLGLVYLNLAILLTAANLPEQAESAFAKGIELVGSQAEVLNDFAWRFATAAEARFHQPRWAVELAKKATTLAPQTKTFFHTLGTAQYRAGQWQDAVVTLDQVVKETDGGTSFDFFFLAMAHWQLGNAEAARKWHDQAIDWMERNQPEHHELRRFRAEAEQLLGLAAAGSSPSGTAAPAADASETDK